MARLLRVRRRQNRVEPQRCGWGCVPVPGRCCDERGRRPCPAAPPSRSRGRPAHAPLGLLTGAAAAGRGRGSAAPQAARAKHAVARMRKQPVAQSAAEQGWGDDTPAPAARRPRLAWPPALPPCRPGAQLDARSSRGGTFVATEPGTALAGVAPHRLMPNATSRALPLSREPADMCSCHGRASSAPGAPIGIFFVAQVPQLSPRESSSL